MLPMHCNVFKKLFVVAGQGSNPEWGKERKERLTASNFGRWSSWWWSSDDQMMMIWRWWLGDDQTMMIRWWLDDDAGGWFEKEGVTARKFWRSACLFGYNCFTDLGQGSYIEAPTNAAWWLGCPLFRKMSLMDFIMGDICRANGKK